VLRRILKSILMNMKPNHESTLRPTIAAVAIGIFITASLTNAAISVFGNFWNRGDNMFSWVPEYTELATYKGDEDACDRATPDVSVDDRLVVLRIDDPQAYVWTDVVKLMVADARSYGYKPVLGIIPNKLEEDQLFSLYLKEHSCEYEAAQHGFAHHKDGDYDTPEFDDIDPWEAEEKLEQGREILERVTGQNITTFIPPQNRIDTDITYIFEDMGYPIVSAIGENRYDSDISTYEFEEDYLVSAEDVLSSCDRRFADGKVCVIMLHPQDYATDGAFEAWKYQYYTDLLEGLQMRDVTVVTMKELRKILQ
jgi:peptidoglycan/xylan/chitin deacetylase (PgdA/CDA1 family)